MGRRDLIAGLALALLTAGCAASEGENEAGGWSDPVPFGSLAIDPVLHPRLDDETLADIREVHHERQAAIATCLADSGFEYIPVSPDLILDVDNPVDRNAPWQEQRRWVSQNGYGVASKPFSALVADDPAVTEQVDPNRPIIARMSVEERDIYYTERDNCEGEAAQWFPAVVAYGDFDPAAADPDTVALVLATAREIESDPGWLAAWDRWGLFADERGVRVPGA